jgi:hypothetical protein
MDGSLLEQFALAEDREEVVRRAIPETEEDAFLRVLLLQQRGDLPAARRLLDRAPSRAGRFSRALRLRQTLLEATGGDSKAWEELAQGVRHDHRCQLPGKTPPLPSRLPAPMAEPDAALKQSLSRAAQGAGELTPGGVAVALGRKDLPAATRRKILERLAYPMLPGLIDLLVDDLGQKPAKNFGNLPIHGKLTVEQAEELSRRVPELLESDRFVEEHLRRLEGDPQGPPDEEGRLARLMSFLDRLPDAARRHRTALSLRRIRLRWSRGEADQDGLLRYLAATAPPARDLPGRTRLSDLEEVDRLLRAVLRVCLLSAGPGPFQEQLSRPFLLEQQAEARLLAGDPDVERWAQALGPSKLRELRERVDLELAPENPAAHGPEDDVTLLLDVKNVDALVIRIFPVDSVAHYRARGQQVDVDVDLEGFVPKHERLLRLERPPMVRHRVALPLPEVKEPGTYIVDVVGGGLNCRALLRKGSLRAVERVGSAGLVLQILDEQQRPVQGAAVWLGDRRFEAEPEGSVVIPFTTTPGLRAVLLQSGSVTSLQHVQLPAEDYALRASFHVEQEDLVPGREARLLVRAALLAAGAPASLSLLERPKLTLTATCDGIASDRVYEPLDLGDEGHLLLTFTVPERLDTLRFLLDGAVVDLQGNRRPLSASGAVQSSGQRGTRQIQGLHLLDEPGGWELLALGRAGEPIAGAQVSLQLWTTLSTQPLTCTLQSDARGRVGLGPLPGVIRLVASLPGGASLSRDLRRFSCDYPSTVRLHAGEELRLPVGDLPAGEPAVGLFSVDDADALYHDLSDRVQIREGYLDVAGLPPGMYRLVWLQEAAQSVRLVVSEAGASRGWQLVQGRLVGPGPRAPARLRLERDQKEDLVLRVEGASSGARVHLFATTFAHPLPRMPGTSWPLHEAHAVDPPGNSYTPARPLGDEARYVLARRHAPRRAGNMLPRPGLLLNPWATRETSTSAETLGEGQGFHAGGAAGAASRAAPAPRRPPVGGGEPPPDLDFLARPPLVLVNLRPDPEGRIHLPAGTLEGRGVLRALLVDGPTTVGLQAAVGPTDLPLRDLRVRSSLDPETTYALLGEETQMVSGETLPLGSGKFRVYDTLNKAWTLLETLDAGQRCTRFDFLKRWPSLAEEEKRTHYSENACHEVNFFLYRKDRAFFEGVIRPYLASKRHQTFLDHYLLDHDLSEFRAPSRLARLNALERILLAERLGELDTERDAQRAALARHATDLRQQERLFRAALQADALAEAPTEEPAPADRARRSSSPKERQERGGGGLMMHASMSPKMAKRAQVSPSEDEADGEMAEELAEEAMGELLLADSAVEMGRDQARRAVTRQLYRPLEVTREYAEQHYFRQRVADLGPAVAPFNPFWSDLAAHRGPGPFLSPRFVHCTDGPAAMLLALAVLDLPAEAAPHELLRDEHDGLTFRAAGPAIVFHEQLRPARRGEALSPLLVAQRYLAEDDRGTLAPSAGEILAGRPCTCQVIVSNPSPEPQQVDLLLLLPEGSLPLEGARRLRRERLHLGPYQTTPLDLSFYFPHEGIFRHHPAQASREGVELASAAPRSLRVVSELSSVDPRAWPRLSQAGTDDEVLDELATADLAALDLSQIAWRLHDRGFYERALSILERRRHYHETCWSYALKHRDLARTAEFLRVRGLATEGLALEAPWLAYDPQREGVYEHLEYAPLVNPRAHGAAGARKILNDRLEAQVERLLVYLCSRASLDDEDRLAVVYYWLLQDRVDEATALFRRIKPESLRARLQHSYVEAYLAFFDDPSRARAIAAAHADHPVDRWRDRFREVLAQLDEVEGHPAAPADPRDRDQKQAHLAATAPALELRASVDGLQLHHRHAPSCRVSFYEMDLELLFSQRPFGLQAFRERPPIQPNEEEQVEPGPGEGVLRLTIPESLRGRPLLVEVTCGEARASAAHAESALVVQLQEAHGHLRVTHAATGAPLPRVYVKVYAQDQRGASRFHKDGYTDLRGRFDYASVSGSPEPPARFALLLVSDEYGYSLREVNAPTR